MRFKTLYVLIIISSSLSAQIKNIAVIDLDAPGIPKNESQTLSDQIRLALVQTEKYKVVERGQMNAILEEQGFQNTGCTSADCVVEIGQLIGCDFIMGGNIGKIGSIYILSLRIIDVESGQIIEIAEYKTVKGMEGLLLEGIPSVVEQLVGEKPNLSTLDPEAKITSVQGNTPPLQEEPIKTTKNQSSHKNAKKALPHSISINGAGALTHSILDISVYYATYEYRVTEQTSFQFRLDYMDVNQDEFTANGFGFGGSIVYRLTEQGRLQNTYVEIGYEILLTRWEYTGGGLPESGFGGYFLHVGSGHKIDLSERFFIDPSIFIGIGKMQDPSLYLFPGISLGINL